MPVTAKDFEADLKDDWWKQLALLQRYPGGFSFDPERYFRPTEDGEEPAPIAEKDLPEWYPKKVNIHALHKTYVDRFEKYLQLGARFHDAVIDPQNFPKESMNLMLLSEKHGHVLHNAAVLWLERDGVSISDMVHVTFTPQEKGASVEVYVHHQRGRMPCSYVEVSPADEEGPIEKVELKDGVVVIPLKGKPITIAFPEIRWWKGKARMTVKPGFDRFATAFTPEKVSAVSSEPFTEGSEKIPNTLRDIFRLDYLECLQALWLSHCVDLNSKAARDEAFVKYGVAHTTLGKVLVNTPDSQFHEGDLVRTHPSFWGLFLVCPMNFNDKGTYVMDQKWDILWKQETLLGLKARRAKYRLTERALKVGQHKGKLLDVDNRTEVSLRNPKTKLDQLQKQRSEIQDGPLEAEPKRLALEEQDKLILKQKDLIKSIEERGDKRKKELDETLQKELLEIDEELKKIELEAKSATKHQIYEDLPRLFLSDMTPEGVYLHRSKAHGRDDFLVCVRGSGKKRKCAVWCTKGVGGDPSRIPVSTAGKYEHALAFKTDWEKGTRKLFPLSCPAVGDDKGAGSWRRLGYCVAWGGEHDEIATVDFQNFLYMQRFVAKKLASIGPLFAHLAGVFVEPYACIEMSCIKANRERLGNIEAAVQAKESGYPVQVVSGGPGETSLRVYKKSTHTFTDPQDYDYEFLELELAEWERVHGGIPIPGDVEKKLEKDARELAELIGLKDFKILLQRMLCAFRLMAVMLASYVAFVQAGWASDTYTGAFSGRNFAGGPRDANEWGLLGRLGRPNDGPAKPGTACATVDLTDLAVTLAKVSDVTQMLEIIGLSGVSLLSEEDVEAWSERTLGMASDAIAKLKGEVDKGLEGLLRRDYDSPPHRTSVLQKKLVELWGSGAITLYETTKDPVIKALAGILRCIG